MIAHSEEKVECCDASILPENDFKPTRAVVVSELSKDLKEQYYNLILTNNVKLQYIDDQFVANIRMIGPSTEEDNGSDERKEVTAEGTERSVCTPPITPPKKCNSSLPLEQRIHRLQYASTAKALTFQIAGVAHFDYSTFPRFCSLIGDDNDVVRPQLRSVSWLMRVVEDIYDARFAHEKSHITRKERQKSNRDRLSGNVDAIEDEGDDLFCNSFPVFVAQRLTTVIGLKALTDQTCWDLLCNIDRNYKDFLEIETFKFFLQEKFGDEDLLFFLYLRSIISKILKVNFSGRWTLVHGPERQPKPIYVSYPECVQISHKVFGVSYADMGRDFLQSLVASQKLVGRVNKREDTRKIEVRDLLYLAVVGYHKTQSVFENGPEDEAAAAEALSKYKAGRVKILANARSIDLEQKRNDSTNTYRPDGTSQSANGEKQPTGKGNDMNISQAVKNKTLRTRSSMMSTTSAASAATATTIRPQMSPKKGPEAAGEGSSVGTGTGTVTVSSTGTGSGTGTEMSASSARRASLARVSTGTMTSIAKERPKVRAKVQSGPTVRGKTTPTPSPGPSPAKEVVTPNTPPAVVKVTTTASQTIPQRVLTTSEKYRESRRPKASDIEREEREAQELLQEKANARAIINKINESLKKKPTSKVPIPSEQSERRTSWEQYNAAIGASERSHTPPPSHFTSPSSSKSSKPFSGHKPLVSTARPVGGYLETNPGVSSSSSSSSGKSVSYDLNDELELRRLRDRQRVTVQPRISSQSLLRNRESSVSAARRERRKSEIGTASTMERRPAPLPSPPVKLTVSSMRSPASARSFIPERRFSTGSGGMDRPSRRASDTSVLSIDTAAGAKKRLSMRIPPGSGSSPAPLNPQLSSKGALKDYSFSEIYDSTAKLDTDADLDKNNSSMRSYEDKNVNPYSGLNSPLKRLRPPPLVNPSAFVTPPSRSPSPCFAPRDSPSNFRVPQPPPIVIQPMSSPPAVSPANTPKASQQSRPSPGSKAVSVKTSPSHAPKYGSPVTPKASQNTPKSSSDPYSYANTKPYPPPPAPVTPKGQNTRSAPVTPKTGPSTATSAQRKKSIPSNSSTSKNGTLRTVPSPAILKAVPPPPPPVMTSGLTVSGLRRLSFRLLNQIDGTAPDTVLGALSAGKPRSPRSPRSSSFHASTSQIGQEQMEEASFTRYFSDDGVREEKFFIESRTASPRTGAATMPPSGVVMREVMAISQRNTPKSGDSSHTPRLSGTPKRFSFITSNLFGPEPDQCEGERSDSYIHLTVPNSAVTAALAMSPRAGEVDNEGEENEDERLANLRIELEREILEGSCGALKDSGFTPNIAEVITDEITLLLHLKINGLFGEEEVQDLDRSAVNKRVIAFLVEDRESLSRLLEEKVVSMVEFVKANIQ